MSGHRGLSGRSERIEGERKVVRIRSDVNSIFAGRELDVVREKERQHGGRWEKKYPRPVDYLCVMPGYKHPGWFRADEVEDV